MRKVLVIHDIHFPFEHKAAYSIFLQIVKVSKAEEIHLGGDIMDCFNLSSHMKSPEIKYLFDEEVAYTRVRLKELRSIFKKKIIYLEGNHEGRMRRQLCNQLPQIFSYINLPQILELEKLGIQWIPEGPDQKAQVLNTNLYTKHKPIGKNASTSLVRGGCNIIFGHIHGAHEEEKVHLDGKHIIAIANGSMCDKDHEAMQYVEDHHQWVLSFTEVTVEEDGTWHTQRIRFKQFGNKLSCLYNGKIYETTLS